jgi:hypothetical protein
MTSTLQLPLNTEAHAMLQAFHRHAGVVATDFGQAIAQRATHASQAGGTAVAVDGDDLEKILLQAMPHHRQAITAAKACGVVRERHKTTGRFLTHILSMRIERPSRSESFAFEVGDFEAVQKTRGTLEVRRFHADTIPATPVLFRERHAGS